MLAPSCLTSPAKGFLCLVVVRSGGAAIYTRAPGVQCPNGAETNLPVPLLWYRLRDSNKDFFLAMMHTILIGLCKAGSSTLAHEAFATQNGCREGIYDGYWSIWYVRRIGSGEGVRLSGVASCFDEHVLQDEGCCGEEHVLQDAD